MIDLLFHLSNILWLIPLLLFPLGLGNKLLKLFQVDIPDILRSFYAYGMGLCAYLFFLFFLGVSHLLYSKYIMIFLIASVLITYPDLKRYLLNLHPHKLADKFLDSPFDAKMLLGAILIVFIFNFLSCLAPATDYDDLSYHLVVPKHYIDNHSFVSMYDLPSAVMLPQFMESLNVYGLIFDNEMIVRMMYFLIYLWLTGLVFYCATNMIDIKHSLWVVLILTCTEFTAYWAQTTHVDLTMAFYSLLIIIAVFKSFEDKNINWLYIAALFSGILLSIKFIGLFFLVLNVALIVLLGRWYKLHIPTNKIIIMIFLFLMTASPYYILHYSRIGTFFFPYFSNGKYFNTALNKEVVLTISDPNLKFPKESILPRLLSTFSLPWRLTIDYKAFGAFPIGPIFLALFPVYFVLRKSLKITVFVMYSIAYIVLIYLMRGAYHIERFLIPVFPLLSLAAGYILFETKRINKFFYRAALVCLTALLIFNGVLIARQTSKVIPFLLGAYGKTDYLSKTAAHPWGNKLEYIELYDYINKQYKNDHKIKILLDAGMPAYYLEVANFNYSLIESHKNVIFNAETFKKMGITHRIFYSGYWDFEKHAIPLQETFIEKGVRYQLIKKIINDKYAFSFYKMNY